LKIVISFFNLSYLFISSLANLEYLFRFGCKKRGEGLVVPTYDTYMAPEAPLVLLKYISHHQRKYLEFLAPNPQPLLIAGRVMIRESYA